MKLKIPLDFREASEHVEPPCLRLVPVKLNNVVITGLDLFFINLSNIIVVDTKFCSVTWHHQRRPFARVLACKTVKTRRGWPAKPPRTVKSVK
jgi:hypothetical protein